MVKGLDIRIKKANKEQLQKNLDGIRHLKKLLETQGPPSATTSDKKSFKK